MTKKRFNRSLIISTDRLGDFVSSFVAINPIKEQSNATDVICKPAYKTIVENEKNLTYIDAEQINDNEYDVSLDLSNVSHSRALSKKAQAHIRIGRHKSFIRKIRYYLSGTYTYSFLHRPELFNITEDYHPYTKAININCDATPLLRKSFSPTLDSLFNINKKNLVVGIHISGTDLTRQIPTPLISKTVEYIVSIGGDVILIGDRHKANEIGIDSSRVHYREENIQELLATVSQLDYLIGPDSGVIHLASAVNTHALGLYSTGLSSASGPPSDHIEFIERNMECRPCSYRDTCPYDIRCLTSIDFSELKIHIDELLPNLPTRTPG